MSRKITIAKSGNHITFGDYDYELGEIEIKPSFFSSKEREIHVKFRMITDTDKVNDFIEGLKELISEYGGK